MLENIVREILDDYLKAAPEPTNNGWKLLCPYHEDKSPSGSVFFDDTGLVKFHCFACKASADFVGFVAKFKGENPSVVKRVLERDYGFELYDKTIPAETVEKYHKAIFDDPQFRGLLEALYSRGVTDSIIKKYRLGANSGRIQIPIRSRHGLFVNLRKYLPGASGHQKMKHHRGCGKKPRLYPIDQLDYETIVICGGEIKALVAAEELNQQNIGAISSTMGETNWVPELTEEFRGKRVIVCYDIDAPGQVAARALCNSLALIADWVANLVLPLSPETYPHGDINDWIGGEKKPLYPLLQDLEPWEPDFQKVLRDGEIHTVELSYGVHARYAGKRIKTKAVVSAVNQTPYAIPHTVQVLCDKDQKECGICPIAFIKGDVAVQEISAEAPELLEFVGASKTGQRETIKHAIKIPKSCKVVEFEVLDYYHAEDARLSPQLEIDNLANEREMLPAVFIGEPVELNESYEVTARVYPHPNTQESTLVVSTYQPTEDALSTYKCRTPDVLEVFQPAAWEEDAIDDKLEDCYSDFEANVTHIYSRRDLHLAIDLAYHSPLWIDFRNRKEKGWAEILIVGDSAQGKTETVKNLMHHYRLGELVDCKNATVAGLIGGLQQLGTRWYVTWGVIPTHDKRLVILEELKGASVELVSKLTEMRSSGVAQIPKIERRKKRARTRLIALSNPRSGRLLSTYNYGVKAIQELIGNPEDIRRFDMALITSQEELDQAKINEYQIEAPEYAHKYTTDLCHELVLFGWSCTRTAFKDERLVIQRAIDLAGKYSAEIPIVDAGSVRLKIARLAAALAVKTFSVSKDYSTVLIRKCHIDYIYQFLDRVYSSSIFGYSKFSSAKVVESGIRDEDAVKKYLLTVPYGKDFARLCVASEGFTHEDIQDWTNWDIDAAKDMTSFLMRKNAIIRRSRVYYNTPRFLELLKSLQESDELRGSGTFKPPSKEEF